MSGPGDLLGVGSGANSGFYLALEGGEGAGKTTVAAALAERLEGMGRTVLIVREPGGTALGEGIRQLVLDQGHMSPWAEALLFAAQRAELAAEVVRPALESGAVVITDRSLYSSLAYQGVARELGVGPVRAINLAGLENTVPDLVIVLAVEPEAGVSRQSRPDRIGNEGMEFQTVVLDAYRQLADAEPERVVIVDANRHVDDVVEAAWKILQERLHG
ncbi:MAG TPA: dTMP kinase [Acidimicrobiia bacterium]|jgi:dTMP kinase